MSQSWATRLAPAGCAWSRSRASRNCRPPARHRSATAWSSTPAPSRSSTPRARWSSSCSSTTRSIARSATRAASARCRTSRWAGDPGRSRFTDPKRHFREADRALAPGRDRPRALHPLLPLRALQPGGRRGRAAAAAGARRSHLRRHLRRPPLHRPLPRQHHRALPGRRADQLHLPLPRAALGYRAGGLGLHALPEPVQRQLHGSRRAGKAGAGPRQRRGR